MGGFRKPEMARDQLFLFPPRAEEFVGPMARVRIFDEILRQDRFVRTFDRWGLRYGLNEGRPPYHPRHMASLYMYGAMEGQLSSRKLEAACRSRIDVKWLMEGLAPDHSTIALFLQRHQEDLDELFKEVLAVAAEMGLLKLKHVAVDGTKLEANASCGSVKKRDQLEKLLAEAEQEVKRLRREWMRNESRDRRLFKDDETSPEKEPLELRKAEARREKIQATLDAIARRQENSTRPKDVKAKGSLTDPDARHMRDKKGQTVPGYNVQIAVDSEAGIVAGTEVNDQADDAGLLGTLVDAVAENTGSLPEKVSADKGYCAGIDLEALEKSGVEAHVPGQNRGKPATEEGREALDAAKRGEELSEEQWSALPKDNKGKIRREAFEYDQDSDSYRCPRGERLVRFSVSREKTRGGMSERFKYRAAKGICENCPFAEHCCEDPKKGRVLSRDAFEETRRRVDERLSTEEGRNTYSKRAPLSETPSGMLKSNLRICRFLRRGLRMVNAENRVIWAGYNLRIIVNHAMRLALAGGGKTKHLAIDTG